MSTSDLCNGIVRAAVLLATVVCAGTTARWIQGRAATRRRADTGNAYAHRLIPLGVVPHLLFPAAILAISAIPVFAFGRWFGLIHLAYLAIAGVPLGAALGLLIARFKCAATLSGRDWFAVPFLCAPAVVCSYASLVAPYQLRLETTTAHVPGRLLPMKIAVLADIQTDRIGAHERRAMDLAMTQQPDLIVLPGDLLQCAGDRFASEMPKLQELLRTLRAPLGVYAVLGDVDPPLRTRAMLQDTPVRLLQNVCVDLEHRGRIVVIGGVEPNYRSAESRRTIRDLARTPADLRILLTHRPDAILETSKVEGIALVIAGHTHGGQVVIPGWGPPITLSQLPREVAAGGLHPWGRQVLYISRGIGFERSPAPPVRLFCPPEVSLLTVVGEAAAW